MAAIEEKKSHFFIAALLYCGAAAVVVLAAAPSLKYFSIAAFSIAAAAVAGRSGRSGCRNRRRSSRFYGAIEALLNDPLSLFLPICRYS